MARAERKACPASSRREFLEQGATALAEANEVEDHRDELKEALETSEVLRDDLAGDSDQELPPAVPFPSQEELEAHVISLR